MSRIRWDGPAHSSQNCPSPELDSRLGWVPSPMTSPYSPKQPPLPQPPLQLCPAPSHHPPRPSRAPLPQLPPPHFPQDRLQEAGSHQVQAAAIHQRGEVLQVHLCAVEHLLDTEQRVLGAHTPRSAQRQEGAQAGDRCPSAPHRHRHHPPPRCLGTGLKDPGVLEMATAEASRTEGERGTHRRLSNAATTVWSHYCNRREEIATCILTFA